MSRVTSADFQKHFGLYKREALDEPVIISIHGKDTLVVMSNERYEMLCAGVEPAPIAAAAAPEPVVEELDEETGELGAEEMRKLQEMLSRPTTVQFRDQGNGKD